MTAVKGHIEALLRPEVRALSAYHVPESKGFIKLDAMENPYAWPRDTVDGWLEHLRGAEPNRYPDPVCATLKTELKAANGVPDEAELILGNGSDEIIQILLMALHPSAAVMAPEPTFVMYRQISLSLGLPFVGVPLREEDFSLDSEAFLAAIEQYQPAIIFLAYPNNPTGNLFDSAAIERILAAAPGLVVVDEAYAPYADASFMGQVGRQPNLLVMRTLSKLGLAGLRLGFMAGPSEWIAEFEKLRLPYNINVLTRISAEFALAHPEVFTAQVAAILRDRGALMAELRHIEAIQVFASRANFILLRLLRHEAPAVFAALKAAGILIKNLHPQGGMLSQCLRVTVGTPEENQRFLTAFRQILAELG
jgi:histidinol-phosphate aminotransferase